MRIVRTDAKFFCVPLRFVPFLSLLPFRPAPFRSVSLRPVPQVVAGGGAIEMELSKALRDHSKTIKGKQQLIMSSYAKALEIIPRQLVSEWARGPPRELKNMNLLC